MKKRKLIFSGAFDVCFHRSAFDIPVVNGYIENNRFLFRVRCGLIDLPIALKRKVDKQSVSKLKNVDQIKEHLKYCLDSILAFYDAPKEITDLYVSPYYEAILLKYGFRYIN